MSYRKNFTIILKKGKKRKCFSCKIDESVLRFLAEECGFDIIMSEKKELITEKAG